MTELEKIKQRLLGKWEVMNTPGELSHYTFNDQFEIYYGNAYSEVTTTQKKYAVERKGGRTFIRKSRESIEIGGISKNWMLWVKGKRFLVLKKV
jgi:hypothetical protein